MDTYSLQQDIIFTTDHAFARVPLSPAASKDVSLRLFSQGVKSMFHLRKAGTSPGMQDYVCI